MPGASNDILYFLNECDEIVTVNAAWNRFARENNAPGALAPCVLWKPVRSFISDGTTALIFRHLTQSVRKGRSVDFCFRCDSPSVIRIARLRMRHLRSGLIEARVRTVDQARRRPVPFAAPSHPSASAVPCCSWCQRYEMAPDLWLSAGEALSGADDAEMEQPVPIRHVSCPRCVDRMLRVAKGVPGGSPAMPEGLTLPVARRARPGPPAERAGIAGHIPETTWR